MELKGLATKVLPVTVSQLLTAPLGHHDTFVIGFFTLGKVSVVGVVRTSAQLEDGVQYSVDDMTGPLLVVEHWAADQATPIPPGTYVKVIGHLRSRSGEKVLLALGLRRVRDHNEITSHMMEVVHAHMQLFEKAFDVNMNPTAGPGVSPTGLSAVQGQVLHVIKTYAASRDGVSFRGLKTELGFVSTTDLRSSLELLISEGLVYSTVDCQHFKSTEV